MVKILTVFVILTSLIGIVISPADFYKAYSSVLNPITSTIVIILLVGIIFLFGQHIYELDSENTDLESDIMQLNSDVLELQNRQPEREIHVVLVWEQ